MEDCVDELVNTLSHFNKKAEETEEAKEEEDEEKGTSKTENGGGLMEQLLSHLPAPISGISSTSVAGKSGEEGDDRDKQEGKLEEDEEKGSLVSDNGGGIMEKLISHLHVPIAGISSTYAVGEFADEDRDGDKPAGKRADEEPEELIVSSPRISLPVQSGPDTEEATILISIVRD